jgi:hypothetical protein
VAAHAQAVGIWTTQEVICYDKGKFAALGLPVPTTYKDLANDKLQGRVMLADITGGGGLANFAGIVYASGGDTSNVKPGLDTIGTIKGAKFWKAGADVIAAFKAGDIYAAVAHTGWCLRAIKYAGRECRERPSQDQCDQDRRAQGGLDRCREGHEECRGSDALHQRLSRRGVPARVREEYRRLALQYEGRQRLRTEDALFVSLNNIDQADIDRMLRIDYKGVNINSWYDQWNRAVSR